MIVGAGPRVEKARQLPAQKDTALANLTFHSVRSHFPSMLPTSPKYRPSAEHGNPSELKQGLSEMAGCKSNFANLFSNATVLNDYWRTPFEQSLFAPRVA